MGQCAGGVFEAEILQLRGRGADEGDSGLGQAFGEFHALREEAIARVHGVSAGGAGGGDDRVDIQIAISRGGGADMDGFIGGQHAGGKPIGIGIDRDGGDVHGAQCAADADQDFAAIGDQDFTEHQSVFRRVWVIPR